MFSSDWPMCKLATALPRPGRACSAALCPQHNKNLSYLAQVSTWGLRQKGQGGQQFGHRPTDDAAVLRTGYG